jgi:hypothetical protein
VRETGRYNPVIGYHVVDRTYQVIGPPGSRIDPAFCSPARARQAAAAYGRAAEVRAVVPVHLAGVLSVILDDVGDIWVDGPTARRFIQACTRQGVRLAGVVCRGVDETVMEPGYSCRALLGR